MFERVRLKVYWDKTEAICTGICVIGVNKCGCCKVFLRFPICILNLMPYCIYICCLFQMVIDFLKFDIDNSEWKSLKTMYEEGSLHLVKQVALEFHYSWRTLRGLRYHFTIMKYLEQMGFMKWSAAPNTHTKYVSKITNQPRYICWEVVYLNSKWLE